MTPVEDANHARIKKDIAAAEGIGESVAYALRTPEPIEKRMARKSTRRIIPELDDEEEEMQTKIAEKALKEKGISYRTGYFSRTLPRTPFERTPNLYIVITNLEEATPRLWRAIPICLPAASTRSTSHAPVCVQV